MSEPMTGPMAERTVESRVESTVEPTVEPTVEHALLHTDGGSRGNPGPSGIGFVLLAQTGSGLATLAEGGAFIGRATNNEAEYHALLWGLSNARALGVRRVSMRADSEFMVKQIKGEYKVRSEGIKPLYAQVMSALGAFESFEITHVYRTHNARADALANEAMDCEGSVGTYVVPRAEGTAKGTVEGAPGLPPSPENSQVPPSPQGTAPQGGSLQNPSSPQSLQGPGRTETARKRRTMPSGTYTLTIKDHFDAAHALAGYPGECRNLHGHTWDVEVSVCGSELDEVGIVYDFKDLKSDLAAILGRFDHAYLNEVPPFDRMNATAEHLARVIYEQLEERLPASVALDEVAVWESPIAKLTYRR